MQTKIIVDSTSDLLPDVKNRVSTVPLTVTFGDTEYIDGVNITYKQFYEKLVESDILPTTSQATPAAFEKEFQSIAQSGDEAVVITISSKLSGTYQSALIAAEEYDNIYVVDGGSATSYQIKHDAQWNDASFFSYYQYLHFQSSVLVH